MLAFLQALHPIASERGDGLRPELLRQQIDDVLDLNFSDSQPMLVGLVEEKVAKTVTAMHRVRKTGCALDDKSVSRGATCTTKSTTVAVSCSRCRGSG
ncbi:MULTISPECIES: hypothetical protein [unclassified Mesorhizobium]|uniref:hypothetical protein n=1 Tax=unclassified Mesorhizobium TaxID=325217 RepID=UPI000BB0A35F|nr:MULTISPECIES: hypothetical protein [unclassified Mesorhizobium]PBB77024.1 hypothetical protein CK227_00185 [Mesorhizobium sp. WSM4308]